MRIAGIFESKSKQKLVDGKMEAARSASFTIVTPGYVSIYNEEMTYADDVRISLTL
jgi:hypothetical protein